MLGPKGRRKIDPEMVGQATRSPLGKGSSTSHSKIAGPNTARITNPEAKATVLAKRARPGEPYICSISFP